MQLTVQDVSPIKKKLEIDVEAAEVNKELNETIKLLSKKARVPGFRPGKTPKSMIEKRYWDDIRRRVEEQLIEQSVFKAIKEEDIPVVSTSAVNPGTLKRGEDYQFTVEVDIRPTVEPKDYTGLDAEKPKTAITEQDMEIELKRIQTQHKTMVPVTDRNRTQEGDFLVLDYIFNKEGEELTKQENVTIELGQGRFLPNKDELLVGKEVPSTIEEDIDYPEDFPYKELAGSLIGASITLQEIKKEELPEIDDSLAEQAGADNLEALKADIKDRIQKQKDEESRRALEDFINDKLIENNEFEVPESMIIQRSERMIQQTYQQMAYLAPQMDMRLTQEQFDRMAQDYRPQAEKDVRSSLILDAISKKENIEVSDDDIDEEIKRIAEGSGQTMEKVKAEFLKENALEGLRLMLAKKKTMDFIIENAKIEEVEPKTE